MTKLNKIAVNFPRFDEGEYDPYKMRVLVEELERLVAAYQASENEEGWDDIVADVTANSGPGALSHSRIRLSQAREVPLAGKYRSTR